MNTDQIPFIDTIPISRNNSNIYVKPLISKVSTNNLESENKRHLVIFDFDQTIIEGESFFEMVKLVPEWGEENSKKLFEKKGNWFLFVEEIMNILIENKISATQIKEQFKKLSLTQNFSDLLKFLFSNKDKFDIHIISGTYDIFIKWILEHHGIYETINEIHCEKAIVEDDFVRFIKPLEFIKCAECHFCVCKAKTVKKIISSGKYYYERWHYIGDGINDICPALMLNDNDFLYPRKNFKLHEKIFEENYKKRIISNIIIWEDGNTILNNFKEIFQQNEEFQQKINL